MAGYRLRPEADWDLDQQADYYAEREGLELALRFYEAAHETFAFLADNQHTGTQRSYADPSLAGVRFRTMRTFKQHLIFYRPGPEGVEVLRVIHGKRDLTRILGSEE